MCDSNYLRDDAQTAALAENDLLPVGSGGWGGRHSWWRIPVMPVMPPLIWLIAIPCEM